MIFLRLQKQQRLFCAIHDVIVGFYVVSDFRKKQSDRERNKQTGDNTSNDTPGVETAFVHVTIVKPRSWNVVLSPNPGGRFDFYRG